MPNGNITELTDRGLVRISGADCIDFLQNLLTCDLKELQASGTKFGALLTPQGKLQFDFVLHRLDDSILIDMQKSILPDFVKRMDTYKLRSNVEIEDISSSHIVLGIWNTTRAIDNAIASNPDPRLPDLGFRSVCLSEKVADAISDPSLAPCQLEDYHNFRIKLGVPAGDHDFQYGSVFPYDVNMDNLNGIDFAKGCYIGQEVISRMKHRSTARKRSVIVTADGPLPVAGTEIRAEGRGIGTLGSSAEGIGIAVIRLDRAKSSMDSSTPMLVEDIEITIEIPKWANFDLQ